MYTYTQTQTRACISYAASVFAAIVLTSVRTCTAAANVERASSACMYVCVCVCDELARITKIASAFCVELAVFARQSLSVKLIARLNDIPAAVID